MATISSPDELFDGRMSTLLESDSASLAVTPFALPGEYTVLIEFEGGDFEPFEITVYVRGCSMDEVLSANGASASPAVQRPSVSFQKKTPNAIHSRQWEL